jgi:hypothetical protein
MLLYRVFLICNTNMAAVRTLAAQTAQRHSVQYLGKLYMELHFGVLTLFKDGAQTALFKDPVRTAL